MTDPEKMKPTMPDPDADQVPELPEDDEPGRADVEQRIDLTPEGQPNRPDQPDFHQAEADQYHDPEGHSADERRTD